MSVSVWALRKTPNRVVRSRGVTSQYAFLIGWNPIWVSQHPIKQLKTERNRPQNVVRNATTQNFTVTASLVKLHFEPISHIPWHWWIECWPMTRYFVDWISRWLDNRLVAFRQSTCSMTLGGGGLVSEGWLKAEYSCWPNASHSLRKVSDVACCIYVEQFIYFDQLDLIALLFQEIKKSSALLNHHIGSARPLF